MKQSKKKRIYVEGEHGTIEYPKVVGHRKVGRRTMVIAEVPFKIKYGVICLNKPAAREYARGIKTNIPENELIRWKGLKRSSKKITTKHECDEEYCMHRGKLHYHPAHDISLKSEKTTIPSPVVLRNYKKKVEKARIWV